MIGYDAISAYGSPSYYAFQMFSCHVGDEILPVASSETSVQGCATRDNKTGEIILKLVNPQTNAVSLNIEIKGVTSLGSDGSAITLAGNPEDTNSISDPKKIVPMTTTLRRLKPSFVYEMRPHSIVVLKLKVRS